MAVTIHPSAIIDCDDFTAGDGTVIRAHAHISGRQVHLGRECFIDEHAVIGGGSCEIGSLTSGDWLHMGMFSQINTARTVTIGDEVGIGIATRIFTHGAYLSELDGFPCTFDDVTIGSHVWLPNAQVNPGVTIGSNVVVTAGAVVTTDLPGGCLAGGVPAKVIRRDCYPKPGRDGPIIVDGVTFYPATRMIVGRPTGRSEDARNELRRRGTRFPYSVVDGDYVRWTV